MGDQHMATLKQAQYLHYIQQGKQFMKHLSAIHDSQNMRSAAKQGQWESSMHLLSCLFVFTLLPQSYCCYSCYWPFHGNGMHGNCDYI